MAIDGAGDTGIAGISPARSISAARTSTTAPAQVEETNHDVFVAGLDPAGMHLWSARRGDEHNDDRIAGLDVREPM